MNQNLPPNNPGQPGDYPADDRQAGNPYYSAQQQDQAPDLDASAPQLKTAEAQRLNRKALMFLGGIVLLLILMTIVVIKNATSGDEETKKPREEKVVIPDLPKTPGAQAGDFDQIAADPQQLPPQDLPPLPPPDPIPVAQSQPRNNRDSGSNYGASQGPQMPAEPQGPTLVERRMGMNSAGGGSAGGNIPGRNVRQDDPILQAMLGNLQAAQAQAAGGGMPSGAAMAMASQQQKGSKVNLARYLNNPDTLLVRGTYIRCVLETRIITDLPGFTSCVVTEPVYSVNGRHLLLPKGSKVSGQYEGEPAGPRVGVIWYRVITPTGIDVALESPGVDNLGGSGHPGDYNAHWVSRISSALFISLLSDAFKYYAADKGPGTSTVTPGGTVVDQPFESNTARTLERLANQAVTKAMSRPATVTINQGTVVNIYVAQDVDFSGVITKR
ncbi:MAG: TrbI/VirB10 family protein [Lysobacteraceae bacterium]|nr:MAG: TrbI/VirB10 family protein [Xanthomonadaceae bacterium]